MLNMSAEERDAYSKISNRKYQEIQAAKDGCKVERTNAKADNLFSTILDKPSIIECQELEKRIDVTKMSAAQRKEYINVSNEKIEEIRAALRSCEADKIIVEPTFLSYKTVRDNFGKRIGDSFVVVQVNVRNESATSQFFVQDIGLLLDPNQCRKAAEFFNEIKPVNVRDEDNQIGRTRETTAEEKIRINAIVAQNNQQTKVERSEFANRFLIACLQDYEKTFQYPQQFSPVQRDAVLGVATANLTRSPRNIFFRGLRFAADMSGVLTGLRLLGPDGVKGFGFLGTTIFSSAETAIPNISVGKMENLRKTMPEDTVIVNSRSAKIFNVFIPTDRFFSKSTWNQYKQKTSKMDDESLKLRKLIELFLVSTASGVLISADSPKVTLEPGGGANNLKPFTRP